MNPDRHFAAHLQMFRHLVEGDGESADGKQRFYDEYLSVMDVPAEYYLDTIRRVFKERQLTRGVMQWSGLQVRPQATRKTALPPVAGELENNTATGQKVGGAREEKT